jgi:PAS domain S-box-containing protein
MRQRPLSILIADDHEVIRRSLRSLLSSRPEWTICGEAADGAEAVQITKEQHPDVVLMDISMPVMSGVEAARIIRDDHPGTQVLIISQNDPAITERQAKEVGAAGYVAKADLSRALLGAIDTIADARGIPASSAKKLAKSTNHTQDGHIPWLAGGGEMGALMRTRDWSDSPLGPPESWPESLQISAGICVSSRFDLIVWWGPDLVMLYNDSYRRTLGVKHPVALGRPGRETYPEIWDVIGPMLQQVLDTGEATWSEDLLLLLERNGYPEETYHTFSYTPIRNHSGQVVGVITPVTETTEKVINERRLMTLRDLAARSMDAKDETESWELAALALSNNPHDVPCAVLYKVDEHSTKAVAVARAGVHTEDEFFVPEVEIDSTAKGILGPALAEAINTGHPVELNEAKGFQLSLPTGFWRESPRELIVLPIAQAGQGKAMGALVVGVNFHKRLDENYRGFLSLVSGQIAKSIADIRLLDQERQRSESLAALDRAKTTFFSNISHELRTPLSLILGPVEDLLARGELAGTSATELNFIHRNVLRLLKLVNTLLDFSRIEAGRTQVTYEPTSLGRLTADIASVFRSAIEKAGLIFEVDCPDFDEQVYIDVQMWEKIVLNLLSNALKFTPSGKISIRLSRQGERAQCIVEDSGVGIPKSELPRIFERFHRVEGSSGRTHEGTGIGLALVQELVKLQAGTIAVESESNVGSRFVVSLPFGRMHLPKERIRQASEGHAPSQVRTMFANEALTWFPQDGKLAAPDIGTNVKLLFGRTPSILLVEDNADMREYVRRLLQEDGYDVDLAVDGEIALSQALKKSYDLILSDVMMPKVDGIQLLQEIRRDPNLKNTPFVLLSARAGEEFRIQGLSAGADDYLAKPFTSRELLSRVSARIDSKMRRHESEERLTLALDLGQMGTWDIDLVNNVVFWSSGEFALLKYDAADCMPSLESWKKRVHPVDLPSILEQWELAKKNHIDMQAEYRLRFPDGSIRWIEERARFLYDFTDRAYRAIGVSRDITDRKRTVERLQSGHHLLLEQVKDHKVALEQSAQEVATQAELLDLANDAAFISDLNNRITYWNCGAERLYGWKKEEAIGRNASELLQTEFPVPYGDVLLTLAHSGVWEGELQQTTRYGHRMTVASRWTYRRDTEGNPIGWLEINSDLTLQKQSQKAARRLSARILRVQDEERRKLARELHDSLGQYLATLKINISKTLRNLGADPSRKLLLECNEVLEECLSETRTISYLLHPPLLDETGLGSAIRWFVEGFSQRSGIAITMNIPENIPRLSNEIETAVFRILQESLTNAHRHASTPKVHVEIQVSPHEIVMTVRDFGRGIPPDRLQSFLKRNEGVGVGLGGMRERARELGGSLNLMPAENNKGTIVSVEIPIVSRESSESREN